MSEIVKKDPQSDGFDDFVDAGVEGAEGGRSGDRSLPIISFGNDAKWMFPGGEVISPQTELLVTDYGKGTICWGPDNKPKGFTPLAPGQKFPDVKALNSKVPEEEWPLGPDRRPKGPYENQHILVFLNPATLDRYRYPTATTGGHAAVCELCDKIKWMRRFKGEQVYPIVTLSDTFMPTSFGGRQRPHVVVRRWIKIGDGGQQQVALPPPVPPPVDTKAALDAFAATTTAPELEHPAAAAAEQPAAKPADKPATKPTAEKAVGAQIIDPPTLGEKLKDEIAF